MDIGIILDNISITTLENVVTGINAYFSHSSDHELAEPEYMLYRQAMENEEFNELEKMID